MIDLLYSQIPPCNILFSTFISADPSGTVNHQSRQRATTSILSSGTVAMPHDMYASVGVHSFSLKFVFLLLSNSLSRVASQTKRKPPACIHKWKEKRDYIDWKMMAPST